MSLANMPCHIRQTPEGFWIGADHPDGPWRLIPAPQQGLPWPVDGPAVPESREPASIAADSIERRLQRLEDRLETQRAALLDVYQQIDRLQERLNFHYTKLKSLENTIFSPQGGEPEG